MRPASAWFARALMLAAAVAALSSAACSGGGSGRRPLAGFDEVGFRIEGTPAERCALSAATAATRARGLMGQDDLRGYDAMLFRFDPPSTSAFYMYRTTLPLSIAWFDADGRFVSSADMEPCPADEAGDCPRHAPPAPASVAAEVPKGDLDRLGIGPGAVLVVDEGGC